MGDPLASVLEAHGGLEAWASRPAAPSIRGWPTTHRTWTTRWSPSTSTTCSSGAG